MAESNVQAYANILLGQIVVQVVDSNFAAALGAVGHVSGGPVLSASCSLQVHFGRATAIVAVATTSATTAIRGACFVLSDSGSID